jgi:hypothetical protein
VAEQSRSDSITRARLLPRLGTAARVHGSVARVVLSRWHSCATRFLSVEQLRASMAQLRACMAQLRAWPHSRVRRSSWPRVAALPARASGGGRVFPVGLGGMIRSVCAVVSAVPWRALPSYLDNYWSSVAVLTQQRA